MLACEACGAGWLSAAPFCLRCGHPVPIEAAPPRAPSELDDADEDDDDDGGSLAAVRPITTSKHKTGEPSVDRALGGGWAKAGAYLLTGEPSAGKSTLGLRSCALHRGTFLSLEMPREMLRAMADRLSLDPRRIAAFEPRTPRALERYAAAARRVLVVDSLQECPGYSSPEHALRALLHATAAARTGGALSLIAISQRNKEGGPSGSKALEHLVDGVLELGTDEVRVTKHRFGMPGTHARA